MSSSPKTLQTSLMPLSTKLSTEDLSLVVIEGPHIGQSVALESEITRIGRSEWCDLILDQDPWASSEHCECWIDKQGIRIRDLGSRNGIALGGFPVFDAYLRTDAEFIVGKSKIKLKARPQKREIAVAYHDKSGHLVGKSDSMRKLFNMLGKLQRRRVTTLLTGETGTGKTTVARAIHHQCEGADTPFVVVNCGALPGSLIEAELFGYEKGAFTGADKTHKGFFEQAHKGTLFLDEIAELPLELQPKLLDVIERKKIRRLGGQTERDVEVRLLTATHRDLKKEVEEGRFREDLFFRISVIALDVPPLRERLEDIPLLVSALLGQLSPDYPVDITEDALHVLSGYAWPGNIRQLRNVLERSIIFLDGDVIGVDDLALPESETPLQVPKAKAARAQAPPTPRAEGEVAITPEAAAIFSTALFPFEGKEEPFDLKQFLSHAERALIIQSLEESGQNVQQASRLLGISAAWFYNRIKKYNLTIRSND